ncbi:MAG TPA: DUF5667 domain-containing protein [Amycolatopsis sp.]|nr:DUF5667 domain-containing protein [Amycolatopsis sp.]
MVGNTRNGTGVRVVSDDVDVPRWSARDLEVISGLRELGDTATPDAAARDRIRTEVLRRLAEEQRRVPSRRRRVLAEVLAAAVALVVALGGLGLVLSKNALPGDTLYGVKRAGESAQLGLTFNDSAKAQKHLDFASERLDELTALRDADAARYSATLADFQTEATEGTAQFTTLAVQGGAPLSQLQSWAGQQRVKLAQAEPALPAGAMAAYDSSSYLLSRIETRVQQLASRLDCSQITTGQPDDLGAVPDSSACRQSADATASGRPGVPLPLPAAPPVEQAAPVTPTTVPGSPSSPPESRPTGPLAPSSGVVVPPAASAPVSAPTSPRPTTETTTPPPLISLPPLLPGLPGVGIG